LSPTSPQVECRGSGKPGNYDGIARHCPADCSRRCGHAVDQVDSQVAAAKAAAGTEDVALFDALCRPACGPPRPPIGISPRSAQRIPAAIKPGRDVVAAAIQRSQYTLGRATPGTISLLIPAKDGGGPHLVASWGGTRFEVADKCRHLDGSALRNSQRDKAGDEAYPMQSDRTAVGRDRFIAAATRSPARTNPAHDPQPGRRVSEA
jgi:hypothetical protein